MAANDLLLAWVVTDFNFFPSVLPHKAIEAHLQKAVAAILPDADIASVLVRPCPDPKFGDYQSNALMALAKQRKMNPRQLATEVIAKLDVSEWCDKVEIAGAGFLNFRLLPTALVASLQSAARGEHLFFQKAVQPKTAVVDFSSPNVAKPMHVGHIRSTTLGDALARCLRLLGHQVITDNHIGDWGTQFGKMLVGWKIARLTENYDPMNFADPIGELERMYKEINAACEGDSIALKKIEAALLSNSQVGILFQDKTSVSDWARLELVRLQSGDSENLNIWRELIKISQKQFDTIYSRLGVKFDHTYGESFYNEWLAGVVNDLLQSGIARESEGAIGVFSDGSLPHKEDPFLIHREGEWVADPAIVRKSDGGFNYTTTDLATIDYRVKTWSPSEIVYVVDDRQSGHFKKLFLIFKRWQFATATKVKLVHVGFGKILGDDGKPFKTRSGDTVKLAELLDEAVERAFTAVSERNPEMPEEQRREIARVVGIGAVKYADLLPNRQSDYAFSWDKILALNGNTAPYLLYAYARIASIFRKGEVDTAGLGKQANALALTHADELALAKLLLNFGLVLEAMAEEYRPNYLCNYLYELAGQFARFFESCPVLKAEPAERASRLVLCALTANVLKAGLGVLGIETLEQM